MGQGLYWPWFFSPRKSSSIITFQSFTGVAHVSPRPLSEAKQWGDVSNCHDGPCLFLPKICPRMSPSGIGKSYKIIANHSHTVSGFHFCIKGVSKCTSFILLCLFLVCGLICFAVQQVRTEQVIVRSTGTSPHEIPPVCLCWRHVSFKIFLTIVMHEAYHCTDGSFFHEMLWGGHVFNWENKIKTHWGERRKKIRK